MTPRTSGSGYVAKIHRKTPAPASRLKAMKPKMETVPKASAAVPASARPTGAADWHPTSTAEKTLPRMYAGTRFSRRNLAATERYLMGQG